MRPIPPRPHRSVVSIRVRRGRARRDFRDDGNRDEPDLTTSSVAAFAQALTTIVQQNGGRQGNVNAILYSLATTPDLYTQPDGAPAGTWESATGLGVVNLQKLIKVFPRDTGDSDDDYARL